MATANIRAKCSICNKGNTAYVCPGCSKGFCFQHLTEHRQILRNQLEEIINNHDQFQQTIIQQKQNPSNSSLIQQIDQWETDSIHQIQQTAKEFFSKIPLDGTSRNPNRFGQAHRMHQPYVNPQGRNADNQQPVYMQSFVPPSPFIHANDPQSMTPFRLVVRPPNEVPTGAPTYMQRASYLSYPNNNLQQQSTAYPTPYYRPPYHVPQNIPQQTSTTQLSNQTQPSINQQYGTSSQSSQSQEKRKRQPLRITDPVSQKAFELETEILSANPVPSNDDDRQKDTVVDSTNTKSKLSDGTNKTQLKEDSRRQFARLLVSDGQTDKTENQSVNSVKNETHEESAP
ncbi:unnamed protein product [Adineta steineri]|uniref:Uncharacterized protein n=1 Tax=Adineta steineri TaxID=433720 RepID=A0A819KIN6_9BILA|nr:unnamed protein product [Adineta steineri]CAF3945288.1 unnamed protein product [Adineta steineri]